MRLKDVTFGVGSWDVAWVTMTLQTITHIHQALREISIHEAYYSISIELGAEVRRIIGEQTASLWSELDRLLVRLWESRSIHPKMLYSAFPESENAMRDFVGYCLPEITRRGIVDLAKI